MNGREGKVGGSCSCMSLDKNNPLSIVSAPMKTQTELQIH